MKSLILFSFFTFISISASAQKITSPQSVEDSQPNFTAPLTNTWLNRFEKRQTKMIQLLNLSEEQKRRLDTLNDRYVTQRAILHDEKPDDLPSKIKDLRAEREAKFKNILNEKQNQKWDDLRKTQKKKAFRKK